jgi:dUTP pyrophosphatase
MSSSKFFIKKLSSDATMPTRGSRYAAGHDLYSAVDLVIPAHSRAVVPTDIAMSIPVETYARVSARSGLSVKHGIEVGAGVVDADFRDGVGVVLYNHSNTDFHVKKGDRIAQVILERISMEEAHEVEDLDATERGTGGFGSTGV